MEDHSIRKHLNTNVALSYQIRNQLLRGKLLDLGHSLHDAWQFKRQFSSKISTGRLDRIYEEARAHGAVGGKLLGAGGGGFFLFYVPQFKKHELMQHLDASKLQVRPFRFEQEGLRAWTVRECRNHMEIERK
jgi:D-glycero-alpha-D-manno-heptose-7-phosphate kinase